MFKIRDSKRIYMGAIIIALTLFCALPLQVYAQDLNARHESAQREINEIASAIELSDKRKAELAQEISALEEDRALINRQLIDSSAKSRSLEKKISRAEERLYNLRGEQEDVRRSLSGRRALLAEILAALQRMGRKPPPALLVTPEDALSSVRSAILLGAVVPEVRSEADILLTELRELLRIDKDIEGQRENLTIDLSELNLEEERLNLLLGQKRKLSGSARAKLTEESIRAAELAAEATSLNSLVANLEREIESTKQAIEAARLADEERRKREQDRLALARETYDQESFSDTSRITPAISFKSAKGLLPIPTAGVLLAGFGDKDVSGEPTKGISIATRINSRIVSPADGWVLYAGPFRSYGQLLIVDAGNGYHVVLAGMERINVQPGQFILVGEPVGLMGAQRVVTTGLVDVTSTRPILYVEFRKDGKSIDPSPWWADNNLKRVSNDS